jgi:hypothetical protein
MQSIDHGDWRPRRGHPLVRLAILCLIVSATLGGLQVVAAPAALALGPGEVCAFIAPSGAAGLGHPGWGYQIGGTSQFIYGATENEGNKAFVNSGQDIGYWDRQGTFNQMINAFHDPTQPTINRRGVGYYTTYKCITTTTSAVGAANTQRHQARCGGYSVFFNNSLDHTYNVLHAYNGSVPMPKPADQPVPSNWYDQLGNPFFFPGWSGPINLSRRDGAGSGNDPGGSC